MSRIVPAEEFDLIEQMISDHPEGIGISALEKPYPSISPKPSIVAPYSADWNVSWQTSASQPKAKASRWFTSAGPARTSPLIL